MNIKIKKDQIFYTISVLDNGEGFDPSKLPDNSLGLSIVDKIIKEKLGGNLYIDSSHKGTTISFDFKFQ
ncbi:ATP-binding protein [Schnuerera ultunensis]|uniref:ATP-binding protein n=1 Tax=Schnuerera ultunensis TaxID=45497 RepID=UPI000408C3C3|nr:ATP-binding protein [Schnuerera ultunensis]